jgi:hypothetical protein
MFAPSEPTAACRRAASPCLGLAPSDPCVGSCASAGEPDPVRPQRSQARFTRGRLLARRLADDGFTAWQEVLARGYEGMVTKDPASPHRGRRTLAWLKMKQPRYREGERGWEPSRKS